MIRALLASLAFAPALIGVAPDTAQAAPQKDKSYSYPYVTLIDTTEPDADATPNDSGQYVVTGGVKYSTRNGPVGTYCNYYKIGPGGLTDLTVEGYYNVPETNVTDGSSAAVRQHCIDNFNNRTEVEETQL
jgi:hypothetical protein